MKTLKFTLDISPKPQRRVRHSSMGGFSRTYKDKKQVESEDFLMHYLSDYVPEDPIEGAIEINMICYFGIPKSYSKKKVKLIESGELKFIKKMDNDNLEKNLWDIMTKMSFWNDDRQIYKNSTEKRYAINSKPRWEIEIIYKEEL